MKMLEWRMHSGGNSMPFGDVETTVHWWPDDGVGSLLCLCVDCPIFSLLCLNVSSGRDHYWGHINLADGLKPPLLLLLSPNWISGYETNDQYYYMSDYFALQLVYQIHSFIHLFIRPSLFRRLFKANLTGLVSCLANFISFHTVYCRRGKINREKVGVEVGLKRVTDWVAFEWSRLVGVAFGSSHLYISTNWFDLVTYFLIASTLVSPLQDCQAWQFLSTAPWEPASIRVRSCSVAIN